MWWSLVLSRPARGIWILSRIRFKLMSHDDVIAANALFWAAVCGLLAFVVPWVALFFSRWAAVAVARAADANRDYHGIYLE